MSAGAELAAPPMRYAFALSANVENLTLTGAAAIRPARSRLT